MKKLFLFDLASVYKILDSFSFPLATGSVNGTYSDEGSTRTVVDTDGKLSISGGKLLLEPHSTPAWGDPGLWLDVAITRVVGQRAYGVVRLADADDLMHFGFDDDKSGTIEASGIRISSNVLTMRDNGVYGDAICAIVNATDYPICIICAQGGGAHLYIYISSNWQYFGKWGTNTSTPLYLGIANYNASIQADGFVVPVTLKLPAPESSDGFGTAPTVVDSGIGLTITPYLIAYGGSTNKAYYKESSSIGLYSAELASVFDGNTGSMIVRHKPVLDNVASFPITLNNGADNHYRFYHHSNGYIYFQTNQGATGKEINISTSSTSWMTFGGTWNIGDDRIRGFLDGTKVGGDITGLGVWGGPISTGYSNGIGWMSDIIFAYGVEISEANMGNIHTKLDAGTLVAADLDSYIGAGKWSWWKLDESYSTDGLGHAEGVSGVIGQGGDAKTWNNQTFAQSSGALLNAPVAGADLLTNGSFTAWTADDPDSWTVGAEDANKYVTEVAGAARIVSNAAWDALLQLDPFPATAWYLVSLNIDAVVSGGITLAQYAVVAFASFTTTGLKYASHRFVDTAGKPLGISSTGACDITIDNVSVKQLSISTLFTSITESTADVVSRVDITRTAYTQAGLVVCLDSAASPANFIIVYLDGAGNVKADKCVAGTYTNVLSGAVTYGAGYTLHVDINDGVGRVIYNNLLVGTFTVADAGVKDNLLHGLFSTYSANSFDNYRLWAKGTGGEHAALEAM